MFRLNGPVLLLLLIQCSQILPNDRSHSTKKRLRCTDSLLQQINLLSASFQYWSSDDLYWSSNVLYWLSNDLYWSSNLWSYLLVEFWRQTVSWVSVNFSALSNIRLTASTQTWPAANDKWHINCKLDWINIWINSTLLRTTPVITYVYFVCHLIELQSSRIFCPRSTFSPLSLTLSAEKMVEVKQNWQTRPGSLFAPIFISSVQPPLLMKFFWTSQNCL